MKSIFTKYKIQLIKETSGKYEVNRKISSPTDMKNVLENVLNLHLECEEVLILMTLDTKNQVNGTFEVSRGSLSSSIVHPREILKRAIINNASNIIIAHNHPSGDPTPSREDRNITERLKECCNIIGIGLLDHIIIGDDRFISFKEKGLL